MMHLRIGIVELVEDGLRIVRLMCDWHRIDRLVLDCQLIGKFVSASETGVGLA